MATLIFGLLLVGQFVWADAASAAKPSKPAPVSPKGNTVDPTPSYTWKKSRGASKYDVQVFESAGARIHQRIPAAVNCSETNCWHTPRKVLTKASYKWRVRAKNSKGASTWTSYQAFTVIGPARPVPQSPRGSVSVSQPAYSWAPAKGAAEYWLKVYDSKGTRLFLRNFAASSVCSETSCSKTVGKDLVVGSYTWQVQGKHAGGAGAWSYATAFSVTGPSAPGSVSPNGGIPDPTPTFIWNSSADATSYDVQVFEADGARIYQRIPAGIDCTGTTCQHTSGKTLDIGGYSWRVRAVNSVGPSGWSGKDFSVVGPSRPVPQTPKGTVRVSQPIYSWTAVPGATKYALKAYDSEGTRIFLRICDPSLVCSESICSKTVDKDLAVGSYTWQVQGNHEGGSGAWSASTGFSVKGPAKPVSESPAGSILDPTPTFTWKSSAQATSYDIQVFDADGARIYQRIPAGIDCTGTTCQHTSGKTLDIGGYSWRVRAVNSVGPSGWSEKVLSVVGPSRPVPQTPKGTVRLSQPTYSWTAVPGATEYALKAYDSEGTRIFLRICDPSLVCSESICSKTVDKDLAVGSYTWQVQGNHAGGSGAWSASTGFSVKGPAKPVSESPAGSILDPTPTLTWKSSAQATSYDIQVFDDTGARIYQRIPAGIDCTGTACQHTSGKILANGAYSWRVRAVDAVGASGWSGKDFSVVAPAIPKPLAPKGKITVSQPTYTWIAVQGATQYALEAYDEAGTRIFLRIKDASNVCSGSTCSATPAKDLVSGDHTWRVKGQHEGGAGGWSASLAFYATPASWAGLGCSGKYTLGDFNGDGRTDRLCSKDIGVTYVSLSIESGLQEGTPWLPNSVNRPITGDFDGDGKTDLVSFNKDTGKFSVARSTGTEFEPYVSWGLAEVTSDGENFLCSTFRAKTGTGDFNGDGRTDVYCYMPRERVMVGLNTGNSFSFSIFSDSTCGDGKERVGAADFDADGVTDWFCLQSYGNFTPQLSSGTTFEPGSFKGLDSGYCPADRLMLADLNRDGTPDVVCPTNGNVALSTGQSFIHQGSFGGFCNYGESFPADLDGDGVPEIVCNMYEQREIIPAEDESKEDTLGPYIPQQRDILVRRWTGTRLLREEIWGKYFCTGDYVMATGDFDGDARTDFLCGTHKVGVTGTSGRLSDLMTSAKSELGGTTTVVYTPSSTFPNTNDPGVRHLVTAVTVADGRGGSSTTTRSYFGAMVNRQERRSLGFERIRTTLPCLVEETACPYTETTFSQDLGSTGRPLEVKRFAGDGKLLRWTSYSYTTNGTALPRTAVLSRTDSFSYGSEESLHTYSTYEFDEYGNRTLTTSWGDTDEDGDELETQSTYTYNTTDYIVGRIGQVVQREPGGPILTQTQYEYDEFGSWLTPPTKGDLTAVKRLLVEESRYVTRRMIYFPDGNLRRVTDETGRWIETDYESETGFALFPERKWNALNEETSFTWDEACVTVETVTDPNGVATTTQCDELCRSVRTDLPLGGWAEWFYLDLGDPTLQRTRVEVPGPPGTQRTDWRESYFDGLGRNYRTEKRGPVDQGDILAETIYNARGKVEVVTEPFYLIESPREVSYEYDALNRVIKVTRPGGLTFRTLFDAMSLTQTDPTGKTVKKRLDAYGRTIEVERSLDGQPIVTRSIYDDLGRLEGMIDPVGNEWTWVFDSLDRLIEEHDPDAGDWSYTYDDAGRLRTQIDAKDQFTELRYDTVGRLVTKTNLDGTAIYSYGDVRGGYSNMGRLTTVTTPSNVLEMDYDALGRSVRQKRTLEDHVYEVQRAYDGPSGALLTIKYPDGDRIGPMTYDEAGRIASIPDIVTAVKYDGSGRPLTQTNANTTHTDWEYTDEGFLSTINTVGSQGVVQALFYEYDYSRVGLVTSINSAVAGESWSFPMGEGGDNGYDDLYRLTTAINIDYPAESQTFGYDEVGRITSNSRVGTYTYPGVGQPHPHAPDTVAGTTFDYDFNGNITRDGTHTFAWDADNLLTRVETPSTTTDFTYDGFGSRLTKTTTGGSTSVYPFGDDYEITDGEVTKYITVEGLGVIAKSVGSGPGAVTYWLHNDRLGSVQAVTKVDGTVDFRRMYRPYGETLDEWTGHDESRGWIDQRNDPETGLTYLHARYYDPQLGIFLSPDRSHPRSLGVGANRYLYAFGNPINLTDRSGLAVKICLPSDVTGKDDDCDALAYSETVTVTDTGQELIWLFDLPIRDNLFTLGEVYERAQERRNARDMLADAHSAEGTERTAPGTCDPTMDPNCQQSADESDGTIPATAVAGAKPNRANRSQKPSQKYTPVRYPKVTPTNPTSLPGSQPANNPGLKTTGHGAQVRVMILVINAAKGALYILESLRSVAFTPMACIHGALCEPMTPVDEGGT